MTIRMHRSTDLGAKVMSGQQGKMNAILLEVLCKGVPAAAPTSITQTGGLATCTMNAHKFLTGQTVTVYGATQPEYNGNQVVTVIDANTFTFAVSSGAVSPATGTLSVGGQKTIGPPTSITRSGTTVTVALTGHGLVVGNRAYIQGADQSGYNGWQTVATQADANTFTFELVATQTPATPATGTIIVRYGDAGLGWSLPFSGTNKGIYKQGVSGSKVQGVLIADETQASYHTYGVGLAFAEEATALGTYTNSPYATEGSYYTGMLKSATADTVARKWVILGDHRTLIILTQPVTTTSYNPQGWQPSYFGDFASYLPGDNYPILSGPACRNSSYGFNSPANNATMVPSSSYGFASCYTYSYVNGTNDAAMPIRVTRNHLGAIDKINVALISVGGMLYTGSNGNGAFSFGSSSASYNYSIYPDPVHGGVNMDKLYVTHGATAPNSGNAVTRGELRGIWNPLQKRTQVSTWLNNDTFEGTGELVGKTFEVFDIHADSSSGWFFIETSDTWSQ